MVFTKLRDSCVLLILLTAPVAPLCPTVHVAHWAQARHSSRREAEGGCGAAGAARVLVLFMQPWRNLAEHSLSRLAQWPGHSLLVLADPGDTVVKRQ